MCSHILYLLTLMEKLTPRHPSLQQKLQNIAKITTVVSSLLLSSCIDGQSSQEKVVDEKNTKSSYEHVGQAKELWLNVDYEVNMIKNDNGTYTLSSNIDDITVNSKVLQEYCLQNGLDDIRVNEENKEEILEAIVAMKRKDELLQDGQEELWLYVFNTANKSTTKNILNACGEIN